MIGIIDYGAGNLRSLENAFAKIGAESGIISSPEDLGKYDKIALPGVGAFGALMQNLRKKGLDSAVVDFIASDKPFLGICLGLQGLFEESEESPGVCGLGVLRGEVKRFRPGLKVPQMGWNRVELQGRSRLFENVPDGSFVYFANSFFAQPKDESIVSSRTEYGVKFCSALERGNLFATQFHPEKSGKVGLMILKNFAKV